MFSASNGNKSKKRSTSAAPSLQPRSNLLAFNAKDSNLAHRIDQAIGETMQKKQDIDNLGTTNESTKYILNSQST
jgi:hypothetical protein